MPLKKIKQWILASYIYFFNYSWQETLCSPIIFRNLKDVVLVCTKLNHHTLRYLKNWSQIWKAGLLFQQVLVPVASPSRTSPVPWFTFTVKILKKQKQEETIHWYCFLCKIKVMIEIKSIASNRPCHDFILIQIKGFILRIKMNWSLKLI